jgi:hypothetical protein
MGSSPDDNFDSLQKVLRLKRYEQPPPRYFNEFAGRVVSRIESGEGRVSWWERFGFDLRPAFAAGVGIVACGLVVYGVATTDTGDGFSEAGAQGLGNGTSPAIMERAVVAAPGRSVAVSSTNPVVTPYGTPIDRKAFGPSAVTPVNFMR